MSAKHLVACVAVLALLASAAGAGAAEYYVSPDGKPGGSGAKAAPWDLATALTQPAAVRPGDTIWLLGGTYRGGFTSKLKGAANAPITVRQAPGRRATIDCRKPDGKGGDMFTVEGEWSRFWGFEVTCTDPTRETGQKGSAPGDISRGGVNVFGSNTAFINMVVHDGGGFGFWASGEGGEIYGCIIYNNGWNAPDRGHGHAIYAQNKTGTKRLVDNIIFNQFSFGIHAYGSNKAFINGFHVEGNVSFNNGAAKAEGERTTNILVGGGSPSERIEVISNYTYASGYGGMALQLGYGAANKDAVLKDNYLVGSSSLRKWEKLTSSGNTFIAPGDPVRAEAAGGDPAAGNKIVKGRPAGTVVFVRPNTYEPGRANIIVYNWDLKPVVDVPLKGCLKPGAKYRVVGAEDFFGKPVLAGTFDGNPLRLPMKDYRAPAPVGKESYIPPATGPEFNVFVLLPGE